MSKSTTEKNTRWQEFLKTHKGQGLSMTQLSEMYQDSKTHDEIIGAGAGAGA